MDDGGKVLLGPGRDRWPGSPNKGVETGAQEVADKTQLSPDDATESRREEKRRNVLRLKVMSSVQTAALLFSDEEIRVMVEQAIQNIRNRNSDYT